MNHHITTRAFAGIAATICLIATACSADDDNSTSTAGETSTADITADNTAATTTDITADAAPDNTTVATVDTTTTTPDTSTTTPDTSTTAADATTTTAAVSDGATDYLGSYTLADAEFGTMVTVTVEGGTRTIVSNGLPDHETGEFPNDGNPNTITELDLSWSFPTEATFTGNATFAVTAGVGVNGVKFEPGTAESVTCGSGESYRIEALQDTYNLGLDFNNAHVQPNGEYHYHGISELLVEAYASSDDLVLVGFAADGHLMYYSKSGAYSSGYTLSATPRTGTACVASGRDNSSFDLEGTTPDGTYTSDWLYSESSGDLDSCNGATIDGEYAYIITDTFPYIPRCLNGEFTETRPGAPVGAP